MKKTRCGKMEGLVFMGFKDIKHIICEIMRIGRDEIGIRKVGEVKKRCGPSSLCYIHSYIGIKLGK